MIIDVQCLKSYTKTLFLVKIDRYYFKMENEWEIIHTT